MIKAVPVAAFTLQDPDNLMIEADSCYNTKVRKDTETWTMQ